MIFHLIESNDYKAFIRLAGMVLARSGGINSHTKEQLVFLGTEHGISMEDAHELIEFCMDEHAVE